METHRKQCRRCARPMRGRTDKRFCSTRCRNLFNNRRNTLRKGIVIRINHLLLRNRTILEHLLEKQSCCRIHLVQLSDRGFDFRYCTQSVITRKGNLYSFIYEFGYRHLSDGEVLLLRRPARRTAI